MTIEQKILACRNHIKPISIAKMLGVRYDKVYYILYRKNNEFIEHINPKLKIPQFIYLRRFK